VPIEAISEKCANEVAEWVQRQKSYILSDCGKLVSCRVSNTKTFSFYCVAVFKEPRLLRLQLLIENLLIEHVHSDTSFWLLEIVDLVVAFIPHEKGKVPSDMASTHE